MPKITLLSPVGNEAPYSKGLSPLADPRGGKVAFLFNGHVSVIPFWRNLEQEVKATCEPGDTVTIVKPNTFAPAGASSIEQLSTADLALVGVCA